MCALEMIPPGMVYCSFFLMSKIRDVYPGSRIRIFVQPISRISDPGSYNNKTGGGGGGGFVGLSFK